MGLWTEFTHARAVTLWAGERFHSHTRSYTPTRIDRRMSYIVSYEMEGRTAEEEWREQERRKRQIS
jgi:hypothetical protein